MICFQREVEKQPVVLLFQLVVLHLEVFEEFETIFFG